MISEKLKQEALDFLKGVIAETDSEGKAIGYNSGYTKGYSIGLAEGQVNGFNSGYTKGYSNGISEGKPSGYESGYTNGYKEGYKDGKSQVEPTEPDVPEIEPITPPAEEYNSEKAIANLKALRVGSYVFAIMDKFGNAYATVDDWKNGGSKDVLGIAYCSSNRQMCMGINKVGPSVFGGDGNSFNSKVCTTTKQWPNSSTKETAAFDDYSGLSNTEGIIECCTDSLAEKCHNIVFANGKNGYMPSCGELRIFCKYFPEVDKLLEGVGGNKLKTQSGAQVMHSSTCKNKSYVWAVRYMKEGDAQPQSNLKTKNLSTRVFVEL